MQDSFDSRRDNECPICYNESKELMGLCKNDHEICEKCVLSLERHQCPFCKQNFKIIKSKQNPSSFSIIKGEEDKQHEHRARIRQAQREHQQIQRYYQHIMHHQQNTHHHNHHVHNHNHHVHNHHPHHHHNLHHIHTHHLQPPADIEQNSASSQQQQSELIVQSNLDAHSISVTPESIRIEFVDQDGDQNLQRSYRPRIIRDPQFRESHNVAVRMARRERDQHLYNQHVREQQNNQNNNNLSTKHKIQEKKSSEASKKEQSQKESLKKAQKPQSEKTQNSSGGFLSQIGNFLINLGSKLVQKSTQSKSTQPKTQPQPKLTNQKNSPQLPSRPAQQPNSVHQGSTQNHHHNHANLQNHHNVQSYYDPRTHSNHFRIPIIHNSTSHQPHQCTNPLHNHGHSHQHSHIPNSFHVHNHSVNPQAYQTHQTHHTHHSQQYPNNPQHQHQHHSGHHNHHQHNLNHHQQAHSQSSFNTQRAFYPPHTRR